MFGVKHFGKPSVFIMCYTNKVDWIGLHGHRLELLIITNVIVQGFIGQKVISYDDSFDLLCLIILGYIGINVQLFRKTFINMINSQAYGEGLNSYKPLATHALRESDGAFQTYPSWVKLQKKLFSINSTFFWLKITALMLSSLDSEPITALRPHL